MNDEVRRELRDSQREHEAVMPRFREALARVFDRDRSAKGATAAEKAELLGLQLPNRRAMLGGGAVLVGGVALAACSEPIKSEQLAQTGTLPAQASTTTTLDPKKAVELDLTLLRTAQSIEALAIVAYSLAIGSGKVTTPAVASAAQLFLSQHRDHEGALRGQITQIGGQPYTNPSPPEGKPNGVDQAQWDQMNPTLYAEALEPAIKDADKLTESAIITLATKLEDTAAQTYTKAGGVLSTPDLRAVIMSIGGIESRHVAVLLGAANPDDPRRMVPFAFGKTVDAAPEDSYVGPGDTSKATPPTTARATGTTIAKSTGSTVASGAGGTIAND